MLFSWLTNKPQCTLRWQVPADMPLLTHSLTPLHSPKPGSHPRQLIESCHENKGVLIDGEHWVRLQRATLHHLQGKIESKVGTIGALIWCPRCGSGHADLVSLAACIRKCDRSSSNGKVRFSSILSSALTCTMTLATLAQAHSSSCLLLMADPTLDTHTHAVMHHTSLTRHAPLCLALLQPTAAPSRIPMLHCFTCGGQYVGPDAFAAHVPACMDASGSSAASREVLQFWVCPEHKCLKVNPPHTEFCRGCGAGAAQLRSPWVCAQCKCANDVGSVACGGCEWGRSESSSAPVRVGRRAVVRGLMKDRSLRRAVVLDRESGLKEAQEQISRIEA
jgi:hypothetical protein